MSDGRRVGSVQDVDGANGILTSTYQLYTFETPVPVEGDIFGAAIVTAAGYLQLGTVPSAVVTQSTFNGETVYRLDVPRTLYVLQSALGTARVITIWAYDVYGVPFTEQITSVLNTSAFTKKAAFMIRRIWVSGPTGTNLSISANTVFGLPYYTSSYGSLSSCTWNSLDITAAQFLAGDTTTATLTSGDVRGTVRVLSRPTGGEFLAAHMAVPGVSASIGSNYTQVGTQGVPQYSIPYF